ncbi:MAG: Asp-tRNA(Asn)/Glu-tRNA(Gln) amidotransferase subunit GatC [Candidatus Liptonbacteria bacterium]|nr:Asp-tRNA(Asn)/Glu-tRNA(Gln) amidotransferase subunit GatC [Candidatus Liptonbacteria bacterium]
MAEETIAGKVSLVLIDQKILKHLAKLARIDLTPQEEEKLLKDLEEILEYVRELRAVDTTGVPPMNGGMDLRNVFRLDQERRGTNQGQGMDAFPEGHDGYLQVPAVFE